MRLMYDDNGIRVFQNVKKAYAFNGKLVCVVEKDEKTETAIMVEDPDEFYSTTLTSDGHAMVRESVSEITLRALRQMLLAYKQGKVGDTGKAIKIQYSWGDSEEPVEVPGGQDAWEFMMELAAKEAKIECREHRGEGCVKIVPNDNGIALYYCNDSICYYSIVSKE